MGMDQSHIAILLLIAGLALLIAEIFIPSGGMILVMALVCLAASIIFAVVAWSGSPLKLGLYFAALVAIIPAGVGVALYLFPRTDLGRRILLDGPKLEEVTPYQKEQEQLAALVGQLGTTATLLTPGGLVTIDGQRMHCESEGVMIDPGKMVRVIRVSGNRLVVRLVDPEEARNQTADDDRSAGQADDSQEPWLDFEVPQS
jgi:membrane-bound ClpP family serine protease